MNEASYVNTFKPTGNFGTMLVAIRNRQFIVASVSEDGAFSASARPATHATLQLATAEATRLAKMNPGTTYVPLQLAGGSLVPRVVGVHQF